MELLLAHTTKYKGDDLDEQHTLWKTKIEQWTPSIVLSVGKKTTTA